MTDIESLEDLNFEIAETIKQAVNDYLGNLKLEQALKIIELSKELEMNGLSISSVDSIIVNSELGLKIELACNAFLISNSLKKELLFKRSS